LAFDVADIAQTFAERGGAKADMAAPTLCATTGCEHVQQTARVFDPLVERV
jgi:hypothetical protein